MNTLACPFIMFLPQLFSFYSLAVSISVFASSFGALIGASYSTFCNVFSPKYCQIRLIFIIFRWQKAYIHNRNTLSLLGFFWCILFAHYTPTIIMAIRTSNRIITWPICWAGGHRRHIQTRRKRPSLGHILCSVSF